MCEEYNKRTMAISGVLKLERLDLNFLSEAMDGWLLSKNSVKSSS